MKFPQALPALLLLLTACGGTEPAQQQQQPQQQPVALCFQQLGGDRQQDTVRVSLVLVEEAVHGTMQVLIAEKDARRGELRGHMAPDSSISVVYRFVQEGIKDSINLHFRLQPGALLNTGSGERLPLVSCP